VKQYDQLFGAGQTGNVPAGVRSPTEQVVDGDITIHLPRTSADAAGAASAD
jgi:hypothetical protein